MKKTRLLFFAILGLIATSCTNDNDDGTDSNDSRIDVVINGTEYTFNTFVIEKHFEDPDGSYYYVNARIDNKLDFVLDFGVELGLTGYWEEGEIVDEFNLLINYNDNPVSYSCAYYGVDIPYPLIDVTVNNEEELVATFAFTNNYGGGCGPPFGDEVKYTNGSIYIKL
ncbi:MAG: hypothetical protein JJE55_13215 [Flavobacteriaceae bacterium]|nr:hypothetical protein [Flavobacteriaceae bacterium]